MNKTEEILDSLRGQCPVIENPDDFTDFIMDSLPEAGIARPEQAQSMVLRLISVISDIAALWLIGLFIYQSIDTGLWWQTPASATAVTPKKNISGSTLTHMKRKRKSNTFTYIQLKRAYDEKN